MKFLIFFILGGLYTLSFSPYNINILAFLSVVLFMIFINLDSKKVSIIQSLFFALGYFSVGTYWLQNVINNFLQSEIKFLLTTSHKHCYKNSDIRSGDFKFINIYKYPYYFPDKPLWIIDDWIPPLPEREMLLFSRKQLIENEVFKLRNSE